ncbi:DNA topoisomerase III [Allopusillimonas ginsengisoli]|uniref:DNA topoisomerase III n=1 Tax=Allopusillimonas ginsengisoli TaxID=453575 RepID=UPI00101FA8C1|nr:DNA topoisomerase III [Allopusillimonas ginsengisoli]TEA79481.1 DNA topoisomerase III [Allopusillimonas ginsengisoli]
MRLFIAEKPSVARAIAAALGTTKRADGYIQCGPDAIITWCFGHMLEQAEPEAYLPDDVPTGRGGKKIWRVEDLPIIPKNWILQPKPDAKKQLAIIKKLLAEAGQIVNAGDPDREGQLLVDEVIEHFKCSKPVLRYWASAQDAASVKKALADLRPNAEYKGWSAAAQGRARADWLIGMNLTRAFTLSAARGGQRALLTVGRVQTPTLALVVNRDIEIEQFRPKPYFTIQAAIQAQAGTFTASWKPQDGQQGLDPEGRLIDPAIADSIVNACQGQPGRVIAYKQEPKTQGQPRTFSLADITVAASSKWGYSAAQSLEICQTLYEKKLTSYPRTDCAYLPESQHAEAPGVLAAIKANHGDLAPLVGQADPSIKSVTWNDSKISAHHGIVPTMHKADISGLNEAERRFYDLICRAYLAQFFSPHQYMSTTVNVDIAGHHFGATGRVVTAPGWKAVYTVDDDKEDGVEAAQALPAMKQGDQIRCREAQRRDLKTKPLGRFTEGSLIKAMENIASFATDPAHKKILKEGDGIGTSATRASIISELKNRGFLEPKGKQVVSTELGRSMIENLPELVKSPGMTAIFEKVLSQIQAEKTPLDTFVQAQIQFVKQQVQAANAAAITIKGAPANAPKNKPAGSKNRRTTAA